MNVYDFDKTIYDGNSFVDFYLFCLIRNPKLFKMAFVYLKNDILARKRKISLTVAREEFFKFLVKIQNIDELLEEFWGKHIYKIKKFYFDKQEQQDLVISASPEFFLEPVCKKLGITNLIGSKIDKHTGLFLPEKTYCYGAEKVKYFFIHFPEQEIEVFFSDSRSDTPLALLAQQAIMVKGERLKKWNF